MTRVEAIEQLREDLTAIEDDEEVLNFAAGHGLMSRRWRFEWIDPGLYIDFDLPYGRVLAEEETQEADTAELGAAIRMAMILLSSPLQSGTRLAVIHDGETARWWSNNEQGETIDEADDWNSLAAMLDSSIAPANDQTIIWP